MSSVTHVSLPKTFDSGKVSEWFQRFEICCRANGWDNDKMALKLPTLLEGEALAVWLELTVEEQKDYSATKQNYRRYQTDEFHFVRRLSQTSIASARTTVSVCSRAKATAKSSDAGDYSTNCRTVIITSVFNRSAARGQQATSSNRSHRYIKDSTRASKDPNDC